jgi:GDP-4-dehydro-6-deoxy-D-mannose reductase
MVRSLITGAGGFVASHLTDLLLEKGEEVGGTYRWNEDLKAIDRNRNRIKLFQADLTDISSLYRVMREYRPDFVYHLAAESFVPSSFVSPIATWNANAMGTLNLLEAVRQTREDIGTDKFDPITHICSSSEVYGQVKKEDLPIKENAILRPQSPYASSKVAEDALALQYFDSFGIKTLRTRMFTHTGPGRTMLSAEVNFASQIARIEKGLQEPIVKVGNLDSIRTFADVRDATKAYHLLVRQCPPGEVYNIGGDRTMKVGEMLDYLVCLSPRKKDISHMVDPSLLRPSDVTLQIPDTSKFREQTGWKPEIPFEQTMNDLLNWWRQNV